MDWLWSVAFICGPSLGMLLFSVSPLALWCGCGVALKAAEQSAQLSLRGLDDNSMRSLAEALLQAMWHCCVVDGEPHQTLKQFADRLPVILTRWPAMALLCHRQTAGVLARLPLDYQREFWRCALAARAWI